MSRTSHPIPSITALVALHELYRKCHKIPLRSSISEAAYIDAISKALIKDNVIPPSGNKHLVNNFCSKPNSTDYRDAPGIDTQKLDIVVKVVLQDTGLLDQPMYRKTDFNIDFPWNSFSQIFYPPPQLYRLEEKKYYKFLEPEDRIMVDEFVRWRMIHLGLLQDNLLIFCVYQSGSNGKENNFGIFVIDERKSIAYYVPYRIFGESLIDFDFLTFKSYYYQHDRSGLKIHLKSLYEGFGEHLLIMLDIRDSALSTETVIHGFRWQSSEKVLISGCSSVILEKCSSYGEAFVRVRHEKDVNPLLCLLVRDKSLGSTIWSETQFGLENLNFLKRINSLKGCYLSLKSHHNKKGYIRGITIITETGFVWMKEENERMPTEAFIVKDQPYNEDFFIVIDSKTPKLESRIYLKMDILNDSIETMFGSRLLLRNGNLEKEEIVLVKVDEKDCTDIAYSHPHLSNNSFQDDLILLERRLLSTSSRTATTRKLSIYETKALKILKKLSDYTS